MSQPISLSLSGEHLEYPTAESLRDYLLDCADKFHTCTGMPQSEIGRRAVNDPAFLSQIAQGRDFRVRTFDVFMGWLDDNWLVTDVTDPKIMEMVFNEAGGRSALARALGISRYRVKQWKKIIPAEYVTKIERAIGIPRKKWRP